MGPRPVWVAQDGDTVEQVGLAWAAWQRGDRASLKQAAQVLCPPEHCAARRAGHLLSKIDREPNAIVTNTGILLLEAGVPKGLLPMALGAGAYSKKWRDGRVIVDSPRYRRAYIVDTATGTVEKVLERQASDGQPSLLDVAPDLSGYVYVAPDGVARLVSEKDSERSLGKASTGAGIRWPYMFEPPGKKQKFLNPGEDNHPYIVAAGEHIRIREDHGAIRRHAPRAVVSERIATSYLACERRLGAVCTARRCALATTTGKLEEFTWCSPLDPACPASELAFTATPKFFLTVPDPTPDILDNDAGFGFVDGEHHEVLLVDCDGKVTKRTSTSAEEEHHVTAEAEAWRTRVTPQLCSARDAVLPAAACDELDVKPTARVPSGP